MLLSKSNIKAVFYVTLMLLAVLAPAYITDPYHLHILIVVGISAIAALGVRLVITIGLWSFGQAGMMAVGAYVAVMLVVRLDFNYWLAFPIAGFATALVAYVLGYPALKLKGAYFGILTLTFGVVIKQIIDCKIDFYILVEFISSMEIQYCIGFNVAEVDSGGPLKTIYVTSIQ